MQQGQLLPSPTFVTVPSLQKLLSHECYHKFTSHHRRHFSIFKVGHRRGSTVTMSLDNDYGELEAMRSQLEGLFGTNTNREPLRSDKKFDGKALRSLIKEKWSCQYDIQPALRMGRVYLQVMWRYLEQQSFYLPEDEFDMHMEAIAQMIVEWNAVDIVTSFITQTKKKPVVGITLNIPIPHVSAKQYQDMLAKM